MAVRARRPGDEAAVHAVHAAGFPTELEARIVDELRAAGRLAVSLVAEVEGVVVGHVAFSPVTTAAGGDRSASGGAGTAGLRLAVRRRRRPG